MSVAVSRIRPAASARGPAEAVACAAWAALVVAGHLLAARLVDADALVHIGAPPLVGDYDLRISPRLAPAIVLAAIAVVVAPAVAARARWRTVLGASWALAAAWALALAVSDGLGALPAPLETRFEYLADVPRVGDAGEFLRTFTDDAFDYRTHVRGHPPGLLLALAGLDDVGLGGGAVAAFMVIAIGALVAPAGLVALRELAGEPAARRAAPFLALAPAAVWVATTADALFAGVAACAVALFAVSSGNHARRGDVVALAAGITFGVALHLTYGAAGLAPVFALIAIGRRRLRPVLVAGAGAVVVVLAFVLAGFWWLDGLNATRDAYEAGIASRRPYADFLVINLAAFALALGPAALAGAARLRLAGAWLLVGGGIAAAVAADLSGLSRGETERIWLLFAPWLLVATAALSRAPRAWLAAQATLAIALQVGVRSPW